MNEPAATDTVFSDTPAINDGSTMAEFLVGKHILVCDAYQKPKTVYQHTL